METLASSTHLCRTLRCSSRCAAWILAFGCSRATLERPSDGSRSIASHTVEGKSEVPVLKPHVEGPQVSHDGTSAQPIPSAQAAIGNVPSLTGPAERTLDGNAVPTTSWFASEDVRVAFNMVEWLRNHEISSPDGMSGICQTVEGVGVPPSAGFICLQLRDPLNLQDGRSLIVGTIFTVDGGSLRPVLRAPVGAGPLYTDGCSPLPCSQRFYVRLVPRLSAEGRRLSLVEDPQKPCTMRPEALERIKDLGPTFVEQQRRLAAIACAARGDYIWQNGRYVRRAAIPGQNGKSPSGP